MAIVSYNRERGLMMLVIQQLFLADGPVSDEVNATINSYNVTIMQTSTGTICGSSRRYFVLCQKGFCIERVLIPSFCDGSAISIVISAINDFGSGPNSKPFNVQGTVIKIECIWYIPHYCIHLIRRRSYYLFHSPNLCDVYSRVVFINTSSCQGGNP